MIPQNTTKLNHYLYETNSSINKLKGLTALVISRSEADSHVLKQREMKKDMIEKRRACQPVYWSLYRHVILIQ